MTRVILIILALFLTMPVHAQSLPTPTEVEAIEFNDSLANEPNTNLIEPREMTNVIDTEYEVEDKGGLPQFNTSTFASQLFWLGIAFAILYFFFARKTLPAISSTIESRQSTIKNDLDQADSLSSDIEKTRLTYEQVMAKAKSDAVKARIMMETQMREKSDAQSQAFNEKSMEMIAAVEASARAEQNRIKSDLEQTTVDLVEQIISKLTDMNFDKSDIERAVSVELMDRSKPSSNKKAA